MEIEGLADIDRLKEKSRQLARSERSPWEPRAVARAFAREAVRTFQGQPMRFTLQAWIDLEYALSPLLMLRLPETLEELEAAMMAFDLDLKELTPAEAVEMGELMIAVIGDGFAMRLDMQQPGVAAVPAADGFGAWLPIYSALVKQCGIAPAPALQMEVGHVFALLAAGKANEGWEPVGKPYAWRELPEPLNDQPSTLS